jgi:hypothetical protein
MRLPTGMVGAQPLLGGAPRGGLLQPGGFSAGVGAGSDMGGLALMQQLMAPSASAPVPLPAAAAGAGAAAAPPGGGAAGGPRFLSFGELSQRAQSGQEQGSGQAANPGVGKWGLL